MTISNPNESNLEKRIEALEALLRANPLHAGSFGRGGITVYDAGRIVFIEGGGIDIDGDGYINLEGKLDVDGESHLKGPWRLEGDGDIEGDVDITGILKLLSDFLVENAGKIKVGTKLTLSVGANGGEITFPSGKIFDDGARTVMMNGNRFVSVSSSAAALSASSKQITVTDTYVQVSGLPTIARANASNATPGTVYIDGNGYLHRVI